MKWIVAALSLLCCTASAVAQDYPDRPVTLIVPFAAAASAVQHRSDKAATIHFMITLSLPEACA